jgi:ferredoxin-NADP reductase
MTLLKPSETDTEGNTRAFSIASGPQEETLMVATRMRDTAFKRVLNTMPLGSAVKIEGPFGDLTLQNNVKRTAVFLAGGIGITPFRSMVFRAAKEKLPHRIFLFYSNRRPEDAPFLHGQIASVLARRSGPDRQRNAREVSAGCRLADLLHSWAAGDGEGPPHDDP